MTHFSGDTTVLQKQADLHSQLAELYQDMLEQIPAGGTTVLRELQRPQTQSTRFGYDQQYQAWLTSFPAETLQAEKDLHLAWAQYFYDLVDQMNAAERGFGGGPGKTGPIPS